MYKHLAMVDPEQARVFAMNERRKDLLEPLMTELNPKAFEATLMEVSAELGDIYQTLFDLKYDTLKDSKKKPSKNELNALNDLGFKCLKFSEKTIEEIVKREDKFDYIQSFLNLSLAVGRVYYKLYTPDGQV